MHTSQYYIKRLGIIINIAIYHIVFIVVLVCLQEISLWDEINLRRIVFIIVHIP